MSGALLENAKSWSEEEFGAADFGNAKRHKRLLLIGERMSEKPSGKIAEAFNNPAEQQGAYKFIENSKIEVKQIANASHRACAKRCRGERFVFVPVDGSTLSIKDKIGDRGFGPTGPKGMGSGLEAMSAIAVNSDGTSLGICGQSIWARHKGPSIKHTRKKRTLEEKETKYWLEVIDQVEQVFSAEASDCKPWYQLDRGADFRELLLWAAEAQSYVTVRCAQDRIVMDSECRLLWATLEKAKPLGCYSLEISASTKRSSHTATMAIRSSLVKFKLFDEKQRKSVVTELTAIYVREEGTILDKEEGVEWLLLTNVPVKSFEDACQVVYGYCQRWRIEEFHKAWKSICGVEQIQLRQYSNIIKMITILASVAMRIERLKYLARNSPELPASVELKRHEIDALIIIQKPKGYTCGQIPTIGEAVLWVAMLGGFIKQSSGKPPGTIVIGRGLRRLQDAARVLKEISTKDGQKTD